MRLRILVSGLTVLLAALAVAAVPVLAQGRANRRPACTVVGTRGDDAILGTSRADVICAGRGNDVIYASGGNDIVHAGSGADTVQGGGGSDTLAGGPGRDVFSAYDGTRDLVDGGRGFDRLPRRDVGIDRVKAIESFD